MITAILARNEADKYLDRVVRHHFRFGPVLVLDDHSDDGTAEVAEAAGALVRQRTTGIPMWGKESTARQELWEWAAAAANDGWVLIADADQLLMGDPRPLCTSWNVNTWAMPLYDCWDSETTFRADGFWAGYRQARAWLFRPADVPSDWTPQWGDRGIHCGHAPANWPMITGIAPPDIYWLHLGWLDPAKRRVKYERYRNVWSQLSPVERAHATSILES